MNPRLPAAEREALVERSAEAVLLPLARLCVGHGLPYARTAEILKRAYVDAARERRKAEGASAHRDLSQVAVATGLSRRDVARVGERAAPRGALRLSPATQVLTHWLSEPRLRHRNGRVRALPRQGPGESFETLAQSVTRHVHPRSLLDEMLRLGLVELSADGEQVVPRRDRVVPEADEARLFALLGANVGDHLAAATENVLRRDRRHLEQAIFSNTLSTEAVAAARELIAREWAHLLRSLVPALEGLIADDEAAGRRPDQRLRVGLYSYHEPLAEPARQETLG